MSDTDYTMTFTWSGFDKFYGTDAIGEVDLISSIGEYAGGGMLESNNVSPYTSPPSGTKTGHFKTRNRP
jgi:hypothetical protein